MSEIQCQQVRPNSVEGLKQHIQLLCGGSALPYWQLRAKDQDPVLRQGPQMELVNLGVVP